MQFASEGADGEDNESLGGSSAQLVRPSLGTPSCTLRGASPRELDRFVSSRLVRLSGPSFDAVDAAVDASSMPAAGDDACGGAASATASCSVTAAAGCIAAAAPGEPPEAAVLRGHGAGSGRHDASASSQAARRSGEASRQPPSVSDSVSTLQVGHHGSKGEANGRKARRRCCVM